MKNLYLIFIILLLTTHVSESQWKKVYHPSKAVNQWDLDCADSLNCISVKSPGPIGSIYTKTTDGGYSWFVQFADTSTMIFNEEGQWVDTVWPIFKGLLCIEYVTPDFAVAGHREGQITITRDGGESWDSTNLNTGSKDIKDIQFINENYGVVRSVHHLFKTYNGGKDWEYINLKYKEELNTSEYEMDVVGEDSIIVVVLDRTDPEDNFYRIVRTFDGGETWDIGGRPPIKFLMKPFFINMELGWVAGRIQVNNLIYSDAICKTTDGGHTWEKQLDTLTKHQKGLYQIYFEDENVGIAYGHNGNLLRTSNGGKDWISDNSIETTKVFTFSRLAFPNKHTRKILASDFSFGKIWMYEDLTSVGEIKSENIGGLVYPNPTDAYLHIDKYAGSPMDYEIFDYAGKKVLTGTLNGFKIDVSDLPAAAYIVVLSDETQKHTMKFIKK